MGYSNVGIVLDAHPNQGLELEAAGPQGHNYEPNSIHSKNTAYLIYTLHGLVVCWEVADVLAAPAIAHIHKASKRAVTCSKPQDLYVGLRRMA